MTSQNKAQRAYTRHSDALKDIKKQTSRAIPSLFAGFGGFFVIFVLSDLTDRLEWSLLIAPFGATCVLVFGLPQSPLAQPRNVIGGHLISSAVGLASLHLLGATPISFGIGVGVAIAAMLLTRTTHPPAGADPIVVILAGASWQFLWMPVLLGAVIIVGTGIVFHRIFSNSKYPAKL